MMKKLIALMFALLMVFSFACAEGDRHDLVYDREGDAGQLAVRFMWLGSDPKEEKPGDSILLISPDNKVMLVDAGIPEVRDRLIGALKELGITRIDYLVASHPHIDHIGGFKYVMDEFEVGTVYTNSVTHRTATYEGFNDKVAQLNLPHIILAEGDEFMFGEHVKVEVFNPPVEIDYPEDEGERYAAKFFNNNSLVMKFTYGTSTLMLAGDLYTTGEFNVVDKYGDRLQCDVIKVNHHGDTTSSSGKWRRTVAPKYSVITAEQIYSVTVAKYYKRNGGTVYHTGLDGMVLMRTPGDATYTFITEWDRTTDVLD